MDEQIRHFLDQLDEALAAYAGKGVHFEMYHLGRSALMVHHGFGLATKDIDIVAGENAELDQKAVELFGKGTAKANQLGLYLDMVPHGIPPLPRQFRSRCELVAGPWQVLRLWRLEDHDLAATKLKSFRPQDREDLQALCDRGLLTAQKLRASLEEAFPWRSPKAGDEEDDPDTPDWGKALRNFKRVEAYLRGEIASI